MDRLRAEGDRGCETSFGGAALRHSGPGSARYQSRRSAFKPRSQGWFLKVGGPVCGCPYSKAYCLGSVLVPLIFGSSLRDDKRRPTIRGMDQGELAKGLHFGCMTARRRQMPPEGRQKCKSLFVDSRTGNRGVHQPQLLDL